MRVENPLRLRIHDRRVVLMDRADEDVAAIGAGRGGEGVPPQVVCVVPDLAPIDRNEDYGLVEIATGKDEPDRFERVDDLTGRRDPATHARMADRNRHVG